MSRSKVLGVDVGGTFTDFAAWDGGSLETGKVSSTPDDQSRGVVEGALGMSSMPDRLVHGTTVATNALLERRGAATALITTEGFADVIEIGRQNRPSLYDPFADRPEPLAAAGQRIEADREGRLPDDLADRLGPAEAVAISLLYGFEHPDIEVAIERAVLDIRPDLVVSRASAVVPEFREFERTATTVLNAFLGPETSRYMGHLEERAGQAGLPSDISVMRSSGGLITLGEAKRLPAAILLSGPAGGVVAAAALGSALGTGTVISFDMGGTSTDVCRIEGGRPAVTYERTIAGYPCRMPAVAIETVGAGGGSIAWLDDGGSLRVGPRSAGAVPGPACYGLGGTTPTVTDANLVLGRLAEDLAGGLVLDPVAAGRAVRSIADDLGMTAEQGAAGVVTVVEEVMAGAIRHVSVEEGADPREATLVAFGGAGGLHAASLAKALGMRGAVIAPHAGVFSALGLLLSPPRVDAAIGVLIGATAASRIEGIAGRLARQAGETLGIGAGAVIRHQIDMRYRGQAHELTVLWEPGLGWEGLAARFHAIHRDRNGFAREGDPVEIVAIRAEATGPPALDWDDLPEWRPSGEARSMDRPMHVGGCWIDATSWRRAGLAPGARVEGPASIVEPEATTHLGPGDVATVHPTGALIIEW